MLKAIQRLFSKAETQQQPSKVNPVNEDRVRPIEDYFQDELERSSYFKPELKGRVLGHLLRKQSLTKTGNNLSVEEKKALGFKSSLSITKELVEVLSEEGVLLGNPKLILEEIYNRATIAKLKTESFERARKIGVTKFELLPSGDGSECEWCKINAKREHGVDALEQIKLHCRCVPYSKCSIIPKLDSL